MAGPAMLTEAERSAFARLADFLIPAYGRMPAASAVDVHRDLLDDVLRFRPDIVEAFRRGLSRLTSADPKEEANILYKEDEEAFGALSLAASAAYYMAPRIRELVGYPGQESLKYDPHEVPDYMMDGLLERVVQRGTIYKPTPR